MIVDDKTLATMVNAYIAHAGTPIEAMRAAVECIHIACPPREELASALVTAYLDAVEGGIVSHVGMRSAADRAIALCAGRREATVTEVKQPPTEPGLRERVERLERDQLRAPRELLAGEVGRLKAELEECLRYALKGGTE